MLGLKLNYVLVEGAPGLMDIWDPDLVNTGPADVLAFNSLGQVQDKKLLQMLRT